MSEDSPSQKTFEKLLEIDEKLSKLYEARNKLRDKILGHYGEGTFCYELPEETEDGKKYAKLVITDNVRNLNEGKTVYKNAAFYPVDAEIRKVKHKPKEMEQ